MEININYYRFDEWVNRDLTIRANKSLEFFERYNFHERDEYERREDDRDYNNALRNVFHILNGPIPLFFLLKEHHLEKQLITVSKDIIPDLETLRAIIKAHRANDYKYKDNIEGFLYIRKNIFAYLNGYQFKYTSEEFKEILQLQFNSPALSSGLQYLADLLCKVDSDTFQKLNGKTQKEVLDFLRPVLNHENYNISGDRAFLIAKQLFINEYQCSTGRPKENRPK